MRSLTLLGRVAACALAALVWNSPSVPALAQEPPAHFAVTGARIVTGTGQVLERGTILVRDGTIEAIGDNVTVPADAWVVDAAGLTAYPGLIDALTTLGLPSELREPERRGGPGAFGGGGGGPGGGEGDAPFASGPEDRPATTTWVQAADHLQARDSRIEAWRRAGFTTVVTSPDRGIFPGRASVIDLAGERANEMVVATPVATRVKLAKGQGFPGYPSSLMGIIAYIEQTFLDAGHYEQAWRIYEAGPSGIARPEYDRALEPLRAALREGEPVLLPADRTREIDRALRIARLAGVRPILYGGHEAWARAEALAAARVPVLVSLEWPEAPTDADPEAEEPIDVLRFRDRAPTSPAALHAAGATFAFYSAGKPAGELLAAARLAVRAGLPADAALRALTSAPAEIYGVADRVGTLEAGKIANIVLADGDLFAPGTKVRTVIVDGKRFEAARDEAVAEAEGSNGGASGPAGSPNGGSGNGGPGNGGAAAESTEPYEPVPMVDDRGPVREEPVVLIRNATVLTVSDAGTLEGADVLIRDGRIAAVGAGLQAPAGAWIVDGAGKWVSPGIIDAHSHIAADAINEGSVAVSSMVGIRDVLDPDDIGIYRAAAGGVTAANVLHGSANPIGGQNAVIKTRWGVDAEGLLFEGAPPGIKFALGENTKRDRSPDRYPSSRMGVMDVIRESFLEAQEYRERGRIYEQALAAGEEGLIPPRRDLRLDALVEILEGKRYVHAHSYRADEILQLLRLAEEFGFRIRTLQHVLEGYRVADEIAAHGAGASTFSDWWAYKVEAYEAIPHNAALMTERGVVVSINSDSGEEMRHLNQEAAKTMRWGGMTEDQALRMVTLNPAIQLGIDDRVGSIEQGKDADLVVWNEHPLSAYAVPLMTFIDGKLWFDRQHDMELRSALAEEKEKLMERQRPQPRPRRGRPAGSDGNEEISR